MIFFSSFIFAATSSDSSSSIYAINPAPAFSVKQKERTTKQRNGYPINQRTTTEAFGAPMMFCLLSCFFLLCFFSSYFFFILGSFHSHHAWLFSFFFFIFLASYYYLLGLPFFFFFIHVFSYYHFIFFLLACFALLW